MPNPTEHHGPSNKLTWIILSIFIVFVVSTMIYLVKSGSFKKFSREVEEEVEQKRDHAIK